MFDFLKDPAFQKSFLAKVSTYHKTFRFICKLVNFSSKLLCYLPEPNYNIPKQRLQWTTAHTDLFQKYMLYKNLAKSLEDKHGFIDDSCDSMLFSGLAASTGKFFDVSAARDSNGLYHRRPIDRPCYPCESGSSFSRDMQCGLFWMFYGAKRLDLAQAYWEALQKNDFIMGEGLISRIFTTTDPDDVTWPAKP